MGLPGYWSSSAFPSEPWDPSSVKKSIILMESAPGTHIDRWGIKRSQFCQSLSFQIHQDVQQMPQILPRLSVDFSRPHPASPRPLHKPFKIKDLGLLTYISRKSVSRRFSWCNYQLLTPSGRRAMKETVFVPYPTTPGKNRLR